MTLPGLIPGLRLAVMIGSRLILSRAIGSLPSVAIVVPAWVTLLTGLALRARGALCCCRRGGHGTPGNR